MDSYKPEKEQKAAMNEQELKEVAGGFGNPNDAWRVVGGLQTGWLAMRTAPVYDYNNEMRGNELYNGDRVQILSAPVSGRDGKTYILVFSPKTGARGYVNASFLR